MPAETTFAAAFNCLWCGRPHQTRSPNDLEGYARLCPDCVGRAQDNEFLRFRLHEGLRARAAATAATPAAVATPAAATTPTAAVTAATTAAAPTAATLSDDEALKAYYAACAPEYDELYEGVGWPPVERAVFLADLDAATLWVDGLPFRGEIVELAAGTGWWSPLLAQKGELWMYDAVEQPLDRARERLLAHGLRAHLHLRDAWTEADRQVDGLFCGAWLTHVRHERLADFLAICRRWLKPGGLFAFIDEAAGWGGTPTVDDRQARRLNDGREFTIVKAYYQPDELETALREAGFAEAEVKTTSRFFLLGRASA